MRWGSFCDYRVKLHLLCSTNRVPISYELTPANVADTSLSVREELLAEANLSEDLARKVLWESCLPERAAGARVGRVGDFAGERAGEAAASRVEAAHRRSPFRASRGFSVWARPWPPLSPVLATRIAAKITAYTYAFYVNRMLRHSQGKIKELWL